MRQHLLALALIAALGGCQQADAPTAPAGTAATAPAADAAVDAAFADLSKRALDTWMQLSPISATQQFKETFLQIDAECLATAYHAAKSRTPLDCSILQKRL